MEPSPLPGELSGEEKKLVSMNYGEEKAQNQLCSLAVRVRSVWLRVESRNAGLAKKTLEF